jgi:pilus assembly protein Flp/PilA
MGPNKMLRAIRGIFSCEEGASALEYGLIAALIALSLIISMNTFTRNTGNVWNDISNSIEIN